MLCVSACFTQVLPYQTYCLIDPDTKVGCLYIQHTLLVHQCINDNVTVVLCAGHSCCVGRIGTSGVTFARCSCTVMQLLHDVIDHIAESSLHPTCCDEEMCTAVCSTICFVGVGVYLLGWWALKSASWHRMAQLTLLIFQQCPRVSDKILQTFLVYPYHKTAGTPNTRDYSMNSLWPVL